MERAQAISASRARASSDAGRLCVCDRAWRWRARCALVGSPRCNGWSSGRPSVSPPRFFLRCGPRSMRQSEGENAEIREEFAVFGKQVGWGVSHPLVGASSPIGVREKEDEQRRMDQQDGLYGVTLFRAASAGLGASASVGRWIRCSVPSWQKEGRASLDPQQPVQGARQGAPASGAVAKKR